MTSTAHIRCGDDLRDLLPRAGWAGSYLPIADPVCVGAVSDDELMAYLGQRARVVALHAGVDAQEARLRLGREYMALNALDRFDLVLLWFEHDLWDQACLIRVLSLLAGRAPLQGRLFLMPADGRRPFAHLPAEELAALVPQPLGSLALEAGAEAWAAFASPDPTALDRLSRRRLPLPHLAAAMRRHLQDLPWRGDGLGLTERRLLRAVAEGAGDEASLLRALLAADPVFQVTDLILREVAQRLSALPQRLVTRQRPWRLTERGAAVLAGTARYRPPPRFQGGGDGAARSRLVVGPAGGGRACRRLTVERAAAPRHARRRETSGQIPCGCDGSRRRWCCSEGWRAGCRRRRRRPGRTARCGWWWASRPAAPPISRPASSRRSCAASSANPSWWRIAAAPVAGSRWTMCWRSRGTAIRC
ncbi:hypothetical protein [Falsiroseomonas sp.]|uniref:hypothetical protein n=1 Tax=Falsiroseomonas sp. TaxID=2870721 RepID=UPI003F6FB820